MSNTITTKSTSKSSATGQDIELRATSNTRLIFRPEVVDNPHDSRASVRGTFIFQKKKGHSKWEDYPSFKLSQVREGEHIKLELKTSELLKFIEELDRYYKIFERYGIVRGEANFTVTPGNVESVILQFLQNTENFEKLQDLRIEDLKKWNAISKINTLKKVLKTWETNKNNKTEEFWQTFFKQNSWLIAQVFSYPVILFKDKAYVGGKSIDNKDGNIIDFVFKNRFTENVLLVEIKTPVTQILGGHYRNKIYYLSSDLSGSISQILKYKDELQKNYYNLMQTNEEEFQTFNPKCMLIIGNLTNENFDQYKQRSFELLRNDSKQIEIVTFDELFQKVQMLINLLEA